MFALALPIPSRNDFDWCWYLRRQGQAGDALERILHDIGVMHPSGWADWQPSTLTDTGSPVAMTFTKDQPGLDLTTEVGDPGNDVTNRVSQVCKIMSDLGAHIPPDGLRNVISAAQGVATLRYGARLGLRKTESGLETMLYAELPAAAADLSRLMSPTAFAPVLDALGTRVQTTMLGFNGTTKQITMYWIADQVDQTILPMLTKPAVVSPDALSLAIETITDTQPKLALPTRKLGFSYTTTSVQTPPQLALYFSARHMFGNDAEVERRVRACGGDGMGAYTNLMDIQSTTPPGQMHHGLVGMTARRGTHPLISISVAAPWHCPYEAM